MNSPSSDQTNNDSDLNAAGGDDGTMDQYADGGHESVAGRVYDASVDQAVNDLADEADEAGEADTVSMETKLQQQVDSANDQILKLHAELDNVRKRVRRDADEQIKYASLPLISDLLDVFDNLRRALDAAGTAESSGDASGGLIEGVKMVAKQFEDTLGKFNCRPIAADPGVVFDPNVHEAISQMPSEEIESGMVLLEATKGFQLYERVVRPSQVVVSTGSAS